MKKIKHNLCHILIAPENKSEPIHIRCRIQTIKWSIYISILLVLGLVMSGILFINKQSLLLKEYEKTVKQQEVALVTLSKEVDVLEQRLAKSQNVNVDAIVKQIQEGTQIANAGGPAVNEALSFNDEELEEKLEKLKASEDPYMPSHTPTNGEITSRFGGRRNPFNTAKSDYHEGIDIGASYGENIYAAASGVVVEARYMGGYGYVIFIDHQNGIETRYAHASKLLVEDGDSVEKGQLIAKVGSTGNSTGPHLHFEWLEDGEQINPEFLFEGE